MVYSYFPNNFALSTMETHTHVLDCVRCSSLNMPPVSIADGICQAGHTQLYVKFPAFLHMKIHIFYFLNGLHHLLDHNLNIKIIHFPCLFQIICVFIKFLKFPVFSLSGKIDNQISCFPFAANILICDLAQICNRSIWDQAQLSTSI